MVRWQELQTVFYGCVSGVLPNVLLQCIDIAAVELKDGKTPLCLLSTNGSVQYFESNRRGYKGEKNGCCLGKLGELNKLSKARNKFDRPRSADSITHRV